MAHSSILAWRIPWTQGPDRLQSMGHKESDMPEGLSTHTHDDQRFFSNKVFLGLLKIREGSEKAGLKLNIQKTKIMASSPVTSWQIDGDTMETVTDFIFLGSKITADGDCSHEIKRCF